VLRFLDVVISWDAIGDLSLISKYSEIFSFKTVYVDPSVLISSMMNDDINDIKLKRIYNLIDMIRYI